MFNKMKRFVAILLSALMLVSALPTSALAEPVGDSSVASQFAPAVDRGAYRAAPEKVSVGIDETTSLNGNGGDGWLTSHQWTVTSPRNWEDYIELSGTNGSHPRVKGVAATPDGSPVVIKHEYGGIWSTNEETFEVTVLGGERTITYVQNPDGNGGGLTTTQTVETGSTLTFPELFEGWENGDKVFAGWSTDRTGQTSEGADGVFRPNILWTSSALTAQRVNRDVTFYAIWIDPDPVRTKSAFFHIRLDGQIPFEPATYNASGYTENHGMTGTIKNPVAVNNSTSAVAANIASAPSYAEILRKLKAAGRYSGLTAAEFEAQYEVIWYVIKLQCTDADDDHDGVPGDWHVDGIVVPRANHQVYYSPNGGTNAPDSHSESAGSNVTVRFEPQPIRPGYEFLGWSEDPDATTPTYTEEGLKNFEMPDHDVTLYAVWLADGATPYTIEYYTGTGSNKEEYNVVKTENATGTTDAAPNYQTPAHIEGYPNYTYVEGWDEIVSRDDNGDETPTEVVLADGSTVVKLYYQLTTGSLRVYKTGGEDTTFKDDDSFTITASYGDQGDQKVEVEIVATYDADMGYFTYGEAGNTIEGIPVGTAVYISEKARGYEMSLSGSEGAQIEGNEITIAAEEQYVIVTNTRSTGDLTIVKALGEVDGVTYKPAEGEAFTLQYSYTPLNGKEVTGTITATWDGDAFTYASDTAKGNVLKDLPIGTKVTVTETGERYGFKPDQESYTATVSGEEGQTITVTNTRSNATAEVTVTKVWDDQNNAYATRPESVEVVLKAVVDDQPADQYNETVTLVNGDDNEVTGTVDVAAYTPDGKKITYTLGEQDVPGYDVTYDDAALAPAKGDTTAKLTNTLKTKQVTVKKVVDDPTDTYNNEKFDLIVTIALGGSEKEEPIQLADDESQTFTVPENATVTVVEHTNDAWTSSQSVGEDGTITVTNTRKTVSVSVEKVWNDLDNVEGTRPDSIQVALYAGETQVGEAVTLNGEEPTPWTYAWSDLPEYDGNDKIVYSVKELDVPDEYRSIAEPDESGLRWTITNTYTPDTVTVSGTKTWEGLVDGEAAPSVTVQLQKSTNGTEWIPVTGVDPQMVADKGTYTFEDLPKYELVGDEYVEVQYKVVEIDLPTGVTSAGGTKDKNYDLTNSVEGNEVSVTVTKVWDDQNNAYATRPESVEVVLSAVVDGQPADQYNETVTLDNGVAETDVVNEVSKTVSVRAYTADGKKITYTLDEQDVPDGYDVTSKDDTLAPAGGDTTATLTNTLKTKQVTVKKVVVDSTGTYNNEKFDLTVTIALGGSEKEEPIQLADDESWTFTVPENATVTVVEHTNDAWTSSQSVGEDGTITVTNTRKTAKNGIDVTKTWITADDQPTPAVTLDVYRKTEGGEGELYEKVNLTADSWSATLENVPLYDLNGNAYIYYIHRESATHAADADDLALYDATLGDAITPADGEGESALALAATNTLNVKHKSLTIDIPVRKDWVDNSGERPAVTIQLLAGDEVVKRIELTGKEESAWSHTFEEPKYALVDGKVEEITYSVKEASVPEGYTADDGGAAVKDEDGVYVVTNRIAEGETSVTVTKTWDVPSYVTTDAKATFTLYSTTDAVTGEIDVTSMFRVDKATIAYGDETQSHTWSDLPANDTASGKPWNYVVVETVDKPNFTGAGAKPVTDGAVAFTNTYKSGDADASLTVTKKVEGALSGENPSFTFTLTLGNKPVGGVTYKVGEDERTTGEDGSFTLMAGETATFPGLAVGEYTVTETETNGWTADESTQTAVIAEGGKAALTFTNTRAMDASVKVTKEWVNDADKADVTRPQLTFSLYGEVGGKYLTITGALAEDKAAYATMTADGDFTEGTFANLPEYAADGAEIAWTVEETMADNGFAYASTRAETAEGFAFTNTLKTMDVVVNKSWVLNDIALEKYPTVTLGLYADGVKDPIATATLENGAATATFKDVPYRASGYTVRETIGGDGEFAGIENDGLTVKELFTKQEAVVGDPVEQEDGSYRAEADLINTAMIDGEIAGAITVSKTIDLNGTTWTGEYPAFSFTAEWVDSEGDTHTVELSVQPTQENEPADSAQIIAPVGEDVTVTETVPAGWTAEPAERTVRVEAIERQAAFVNTRETVNALTVTKTWNTNGVQIATPDVELTIGRIADGMDAYENVTTVTFEEQEGDTWTETLTGDFPTHDESGNAYTYAVIGERALDEEAAAVLEQYTPDYTATAIPANGETALGATNTIGDVVTVTIVKNVVDPTRETVPDKFTINYAVADAEGNTLFTGGPVTLGDGEKATIAVPSGATVTVTEDTTAAWDVAYENNGVAFTADGTITVTNTRKLTSLDVTKTWLDGNNAGETRPTAEEFAGWFTLYRQAGEKTAWEVVVEATPTVSEDLATVTYDNLPKYNAQGVKYTYAAEETPTDEYAIMSISNSVTIVLYDGSSDGETHSCALNGATITNRLEATVPVTIEKQWLDGDGNPLDADYIPAGTIQVQLYRNGEELGEPVELSADNDWKTTVNVAKYDENGAKYTYSVAETALVIDETAYEVEDGKIAVDGITYTVGAKATEDDYAFIVTNARGDEPEVKPEKDLDEDNSDLTIYDEDKQMVDVGDELTYTIRWDNYTSKAQTITITDTLPTGLEYVSATEKLEGVNAEITDFAVSGQTVSWTIAAQPFASGTVSLTAKVTEDALTGEPSPTVQNKATVTLGGNRYDIETEPTTVSNAAIDVEKRIVNGGETPYELGDAIEYEVVVTNTGNVTLKDIEFADALYDGANLPDGAAMSDGKIVIAELAPQKSITFEYSHVVTSDDILNGEVPNTATATADDPTKDGGEKVTDSSDQSAELEDVKAGVEVEKTTETAGPVAAGETIAYTIVVRNTGNVALHNVKVVDHLEGIAYVEDGTFTVENGTATIDTIPAYGSVKLTATYTVTEADVAAGHVRNAVTVTTDPVPDPDPDQPEPHEPKDEDEIDTPTQPTKSVDIGDGAQVEVGGKLTYTIRYYNPYDAEATVTITDVLDPGVRFDSATDGGTETNGTVTWTIANVQPHSAGSVQVTVVVTDDAKLQQAGEDVAQVANLADVAVRTEEQGYEGTTNRVVNPLAPDEPQAPTKSVDVGDGSGVKVGDVLTYTISYYNHNNAKAAVTILDELDPGVTFIEASDGGENIGGVVTWTIADVPALTAGSVTLKVQVNESAKRIDEDETTATVENDAQVGIGGDKAVDTNVVVNPIASESGDAQQPVKAATQVAGEPFAEGTTVKVGDEITYRIDYRNFTNSRATVTITDVLDPGVELVADEAPAYTYDEAARTLTWEMETEPFTDGSVTFTVRVTEAARLLDAEDKARATVDNLANVAVGEWSKDTNEVVIDVADDVPTEPTKTATEIDDVVITAEGAEVAVGETITYEIAYTNHTNDVVNVAIADALDVGVDFVEASDGGAYSASDRTVYWQIENVAPFTSGTVTLTVRVNETAKEIGAGETMATVDNMANVAIGALDPAPTGEVVIPVEPDDPETTTPEKTYDEIVLNEFGMIEVGDEITYRISYYNNLNVPATVTITDALDAGLDYVSSDNGGRYDAAAHAVTWALENVAPFTGGTVTLTVRVNESALDAAFPTVDNTAIAQVGNQVGFDSDPVEIPVYNPDVEIDKALVDERPVEEQKDYYAVGETVTFTITVANTGNVTLNDLIVIDEIDAAGDAVIVPGEGYAIDADGNAVIESLEPGETVVVRAEYVVQAGDVGGEPIVNRAYAVAPDPTGDPDKPDVGDGDEEPFTPDKATAMSGEKIWNDQGDAYGMRPQAITVRLYADGEEYAVQTVTARDDWAYAFTGLPTHHADGTAIRYTIAEDAVAGYDTTYIAVDGSHWNIRNDLRQPAPVDIDPNGVSLNIGFVTMNVGDCFE